MTRRDSGKWAIGAVLAAGAGYLLGVLTAPKSGKETRKDIKQAASKAKTESERKLKELYSDLDNLIDKGRDATKSASTKAKKELDNAVNKAQKAKDKARGLLSALHEGEAEDKDLNKAITEIKQAAKHLREYLTSNPRS